MKPCVLSNRFKVTAIGLILVFLRPHMLPADDVVVTQMLNNVRAQGWIQFRMASGRIACTGSPQVNFSNTAGPLFGGRRERLTIHSNGATPTIAYEMTDATSQFLLDTSAGNRFQIRRIPKSDRSDAVGVEFRQVPGEPILLKVGAKGQERSYRAESIWHLFLLEPAVCRERLAPLLRSVHREIDFAKTAVEVEENLVRTAASSVPDQKRWSEWVDRLGDSRFTVREAADRQLRAEGRVVFAYLSHLDVARLDAEQRYRVQRILQSLSNTGNDETVAQIANWLSGDAVTWLALLSSDNPTTRRVAAQRLAGVTEIPIRFDPDGTVPERQKQVDVLRAKLLHN